MNCPNCGRHMSAWSLGPPDHDRAWKCPDCDLVISDEEADQIAEDLQESDTLVCDKCGAENWNLASVGKSHDQRANEVKGYDACDGVWRFPRDLDADRQPGKLIFFPIRKENV